MGLKVITTITTERLWKKAFLIACLVTRKIRSDGQTGCPLAEMHCSLHGTFRSLHNNSSWHHVTMYQLRTGLLKKERKKKRVKCSERNNEPLHFFRTFLVKNKCQFFSGMQENSNSQTHPPLKTGDKGGLFVKTDIS